MQIPPFSNNNPNTFIPRLIGAILLSSIPWLLALPFSNMFFNRPDPDKYLGLVTMPPAATYILLLSTSVLCVLGGLGTAVYRVAIDPFRILFTSTTPISIITAFSLAGEAHQARIPFYTNIGTSALQISFELLSGPSRMCINGILALDKNAAAKGAALVGLQTLGYIAINYATSKDKDDGRVY